MLALLKQAKLKSAPAVQQHVLRLQFVMLAVHLTATYSVTFISIQSLTQTIIKLLAQDVIMKFKKHITLRVATLVQSAYMKNQLSTQLLTTMQL